MADRRLHRLLRQVQFWRSSDRSESDLRPSPDLSDADVRRLRRMIDDCIEGRGGEVAARRRATSIGTAVLDLDETGRRRFFQLLVEEYDHDDDAVDTAIARVLRANDSDERREAEAELALTLQPRRERLLRRFVGIEGGLPFLIDLRESLLPYRRETTGLRALDAELRQILTSWFDVALLRLERLDWDSPASLVEKLIEYEAVHAITSWEDLRGRLGSARRCYAFLHPSMPDEPLIFVEVALTKGISDALPPLLDHSAHLVESEADTAIFYSISNCHEGLAGVPLGDLLIKQVVQRLSSEVPALTTFSTLSPIPGFRRWLQSAIEAEYDHLRQHTSGAGVNEASDPEPTHTPPAASTPTQPTTSPSAPASGEGASGPVGGPDRSDAAPAAARPNRSTGGTAEDHVPLLSAEEQLALSPHDPGAALAELEALVNGPAPADETAIEPYRSVLMRLAARYLVEERRNGGAADPVAHFHLSNGARIERINWWANPDQAGWERGLSMMVNYRYRPEWIEDNHDVYVTEQRIITSSDVARLLDR